MIPDNRTYSRTYNIRTILYPAVNINKIPSTFSISLLQNLSIVFRFFILENHLEHSKKL